MKLELCRLQGPDPCDGADHHPGRTRRQLHQQGAVRCLDIVQQLLHLRVPLSQRMRHSCRGWSLMIQHVYGCCQGGCPGAASGAAMAVRSAKHRFTCGFNLA